MTESELIVYLPLIGAILGAFVGALLNSWYRGLEAKRAEARERRALLNLIRHEVFYNGTLMNAAARSPDDDDLARYTFGSLYTETWDTARDRLAQLLPIEDLFPLASYYATVKRISTSPRPEQWRPSEALEEYVEQLGEYQDQINEIVAKHQP